jgi:hypothetical protein
MFMRIHNGCFFIALVGLSGCGRVVDWGKELLPQGNSFKQNLSAAREYVHSVTAYDQLSTSATFDVLWLSDEVRSAYVRLFVDRRGKGEEQYATILRRQLEENNFVLAFYVLCPFAITLGDADAEWMAFLRINGAQYTPTDVKIVDLAPEYSAIFDKKISRFKQAYIIKFDARDANDTALITSKTSELSLVFRSLRKDVTLTWQLAKAALQKTTSTNLPAQDSGPTTLPVLKKALAPAPTVVTTQKTESLTITGQVQTPTAEHVSTQKTMTDQATQTSAPTQEPVVGFASPSLVPAVLQNSVSGSTPVLAVKG